MSVETAPGPGIELVVARYEEAVAWTRNVPAAVRVTIYDKGGDLDAASVSRARVVRLPNLGHEAHTYLQHILDNYDSLAPLTVYCQGHPFDHASDLHHVLRALVAGEREVVAFHWLGFIIDSDDARGRRLFVDWSKNRDGRELRLDLFHQRLFDRPAPEWVRFYPGAQFAVTAACVRAKPREFYARALSLSQSFPDAGHCFERLWDRVFGVEGVDPVLLGDDPVRYLKPIRRLRDQGAG